MQDMKITALCALFLLSACSATTTSMRQPSSADLPWGLQSSEIPEAQAVNRWTDPKYEDPSAPGLDTLERVEVPGSCGDKDLYPTHPQQMSKTYHVYRVANYTNNLIPANSRVCKITTNGSVKYCVQTDTFSYSVISDIYQDGCGNLYRGVWNVGFLKRDDNMGTLFSKGRTMYEKENSQFRNDMEEGQTYSLSRKDFLFLTPAFPGDKEKAQKLFQQARQTHYYDERTRLFRKK